jgi:colanic acid biosynthesis glycosyl transferase WcaI
MRAVTPLAIDDSVDTIPASCMSDTNNILVLSYFYRPEPNFITADVAEELARGSKVTVVTVHPNYPFGKFYAGTRWWMPSRTVEGNGAVVWRLPFFPDHSRSRLRRVISYITFTIAIALFAPIVAGRPRTVWVYQTPFSTVLAALWFKVFYGSRLVLTCADLWPESFTAIGVAKPGPLMRLLFAYRRLTNRWADHIICSTRGTLEKFHEEGIPLERLEYIPVWVDGVDRGNPVSPTQADADVPSIVYAGNLGPAQQLETVVAAADLLLQRGRRVRFDLYGAGSSEGDLRQMASGVGNVAFHGRVTPDEVFGISSAAFAQIVILRSTPLFRSTIPSKLFFCMAAAAPMLYGLEGESAQLAEQSGGGIAFESADPTSLADAVERLLELPAEQRLEMRGRLRAFYQQNFSRGTLLERYRKVFLPERNDTDRVAHRPLRRAVA